MVQKIKNNILLVFVFLSVQLSVQAQKNNWQAASFEVVKSNYKTFKTSQYAHVFSNSKNNIVRLAPELEGLKGVTLPLDQYKNGTNAPLKLKFKENVQLLIGTFQEKDNKDYFQFSAADNAKLALENGVTVTGLPAVNVYAI